MNPSPAVDPHRAARVARGALVAWLFAVAIAGVCLYAFSGRLAALVPPDNPCADALWIGEISQITRIRLDGQQPPLILAGAARALAVDPAGSIWVYGEGLRAYDFTGALLGAVATEPDNTSKALLAVNPHSGDAWLALGHRLHRYAADLTLVSSRDLPDAAVQLAFAATTGRLWVATRSGVSVRDAAGSELFGLPPTGSGEIRALALDAQGFAWVSDGQSLRRYSPQGDLELSLALPGVDQVAPAADRLWLLSDRRVLLIDAATGAEHLALEPFSGGSGPELLIANPVDGSAFVARDKSLLQIAADGAIAPVAEQPEKIRALALYADLTPPSLSFVAPAPGTLTNDERPALALNFADAATGVDPATLEIADDGVPLPVACNFTADTADCLPQASLSDGSHTLSATIADHAGNRSAPALTQVEVDTLAPVITLDLPGGAAVTNQASFTLAGSLSETASLSLDGAALALDAALHFSHSVTLAEGENTYNFAATDAAGNTGTAAARVTLDTQPPSLPESSQIQVGAAEGGAITVTGVVSSVEAGAILVITNPRTGETVTVAANPDGSFFAQIAAQSSLAISSNSNCAMRQAIKAPYNPFPSVAQGTCLPIRRPLRPRSVKRRSPRWPSRPRFSTAVRHRSRPVSRPAPSTRYALPSSGVACSTRVTSRSPG